MPQATCHAKSAWLKQMLDFSHVAIRIKIKVGGATYVKRFIYVKVSIPVNDWSDETGTGVKGMMKAQPQGSIYAFLSETSWKFRWSEFE